MWTDERMVMTKETVSFSNCLAKAPKNVDESSLFHVTKSWEVSSPVFVTV
jgi:hypothetical protein